MSCSQWRSVLIVPLRFVITLLFVPAILVKLRNPGAWAHLFTTWGYRLGVHWSLALSKSLDSQRYGFQPSLHWPALP